MGISVCILKQVNFLKSFPVRYNVEANFSGALSLLRSHATATTTTDATKTAQHATVMHSCSPSRRSHDRVHAPHLSRGGDEREREREGLKVGRSERSRTTWAAVKGPQCWGRKWRLNR